MECKPKHIGALLRDEHSRLVIKTALIRCGVDFEGALGEMSDTNTVDVVLSILGVPEDNWDSDKCCLCDEALGSCSNKCGMVCRDSFYHFSCAPLDDMTADEFVKGFLDMVDLFKGVFHETM